MGVVNLGDASVTVAVRLYDAGGVQVGTVRHIQASPGQWVQEDDIFGKAGAGDQTLASATVQVETAGQEAWAYASVIDNATGDPTTIPLLTAPSPGT